ncbi:MAG: DUF2934 domain-containing protein [Granulosicoccaceae bacterium]
MPPTSGSRKKASKKKTARKVKSTTSAKNKTSPKKKAGKKISGKRTNKPAAKAISPVQRHAMICEAAYYLAEQRGFSGNSDMDDWLAAEALIDSQLG